MEKYLYPLLLTIFFFSKNGSLAGQSAAPDSTLDLAATIFKNREKNTWMFKWHWSALLPKNSLSTAATRPFADTSSGRCGYSNYFDREKPPIAVSIEGRFGQRWTMLTSLAFLPRPTGSAFFYLNSRSELRLYHGFWRAVRQAANLNGFYSSLEFALMQAKTCPDNLCVEDLENIWQQTTTARFGFQTRLLRHGFFDVSLGLGRRVRRNTQWSWFEKIEEPLPVERTLVLDPRLTFGLAFGDFEKTRTDPTTRNRVFNRTSRAPLLVKLDLLNFFKYESLQTWRGRPSAEIEWRIPRTDFHLVGELAAPFFAEKKRENWSDGGYGWSAGIEPRWYFSQNFWQRDLPGMMNGVFVGWNFSFERVRLITYYLTLRTPKNLEKRVL